AESRTRDILSEWGDEQNRSHDPDSANNARPLGCCTASMIDVGTGKRTGTRKAKKETASEVRDSFAEALLIHIELLAGLCRNRLGHRHSFQETEKGDGGCTAGKGSHLIPIQLRQRERREFARHG